MITSGSGQVGFLGRLSLRLLSQLVRAEGSLNRPDVEFPERPGTSVGEVAPEPGRSGTSTSGTSGSETVFAVILW